MRKISGDHETSSVRSGGSENTHERWHNGGGSEDLEAFACDLNYFSGAFLRLYRLGSQKNSSYAATQVKAPPAQVKASLN